MEFDDLDTQLDFFQQLHKGIRPEGWRVFILSDDESKRKLGGDSMRRLILDMTQNARMEGYYDVKTIEIPEIDLSKITNPFANEEFRRLWKRAGSERRVGIEDGEIVVPIFHNADSHPTLPQFAFTERKPGIFSLSNQGYRDGYRHIFDRSKRDCYDVLRV